MGKSRADYQNERLDRKIDMVDFDGVFDDETTFTSQFMSQACDCEGISGQKPIDTLFENTIEDCIEAPRSDLGPRPYKAGQADNPHNPRFGATTPPNHSGVDNPAPVDTKKYLYPHRRY